MRARPFLRHCVCFCFETSRTNSGSLVRSLHIRPFLRHCVFCCFETSNAYSKLLDTSIQGHAIIVLGRPSYEETPISELFYPQTTLVIFIFPPQFIFMKFLNFNIFLLWGYCNRFKGVIMISNKDCFRPGLGILQGSIGCTLKGDIDLFKDHFSPPPIAPKV